MLALAVCGGSAPLVFSHDDQFPLCLSARIRDRIASRLPTDRLRSLSAYRLLYHQLAQEGFIGYRLPEIDIDGRGKPYLPEIPELGVSLSHRAAWVACALSPDPVGIDVEPLSGDSGALADVDQLAQFLHSTERSWLAAREGGDRRRAFCLLWTRKEAYLKATGRGLAEGLEHFSALPSERGGFAPVQDATRPGRHAWALSLGRMVPGVLVSVCQLAERPSLCRTIGGSKNSMWTMRLY
jgi:4'-phosphopantetheinyl transferase